MNREVFLSILALDSYQRGYAVGIGGVGGVNIGNATILEIELPEGSEALGFYASAYQWESQTVISYRGTDFDVMNNLAQGDGVTTNIKKVLDSEFVKDFWNGWSTFTGFGTNSQFTLAETFLSSVNGSNVLVTGHSLGGGLGGLVGSLTGAQLVLSDPMPFDAANDNASHVGSIAA